MPNDSNLTPAQLEELLRGLTVTTQPAPQAVQAEMLAHMLAVLVKKYCGGGEFTFTDADFNTVEGYDLDFVGVPNGIVVTVVAPTKVSE